MSSNALRVAVAEDEPYNRKRLVRLLEEAGCEVVAAFEDGSSVQAWLAEQPEVDALFLDIRMPGASGLEVAEGSTSALPIVFVTAFSDHAVEAFDLEAADYLLKPVRAERLVRCLDRIRAMKAHGQAPILTPATSKKIMRYAAKAGEGVVFVDLSRTTHFEVEAEVVYAYAGERLETQWKTLVEVEQHFANAGLLRIHRHLLVRPEAIVGLKPTFGGRVIVTLPGGIELLASRGATLILKGRLGLS